MYDDDLNVCYNMIMNNWCNSISGELRINVSVLRDMIDIRDGVKECDSLCMNDVLCPLVISVSTNVYHVSAISFDEARLNYIFILFFDILIFRKIALL